MPHEVISLGNLVFVETEGPVDFQDRMSMVEELERLNVPRDGRGLIIDHHNAKITMDPKDAIEFGKSIIRLQETSPFDFIYVIASPQNREIIDISVMCAHVGGVAIAVCESTTEAFSKMSRDFPSHYQSGLC